MKKEPDPATSSYLVALSFNREGGLVVSGISEVREKPSRSDVVACLQSDLTGITISPPGESVSLEIPIDFP